VSLEVTDPTQNPVETPAPSLPNGQPDIVPWSSWTGQAPVFSPPLGGVSGDGQPPYFQEPGRGGPRRRRWPIALASLGLLATLGVGVAVGSALDRALSTNGANVISASSAPNITISGSALSVQQSLENVARAVEPSVVKITSVSNQSEAIGSGDVLTANGYILTNDHVVAGYNSYTVTVPGGATYSATLVGQDAQDDLAVLKIAATNLKPIAFSDSSKAQVGELAVAIGYPLGQQETATYGMVSALNRAASEAPSGPAGEPPGLVQTSAQLNPGNSGGALVSLSGQLIGIPTLSATNSETGSSANGIGYAISSDRAAYVASQLIQHGKLTSTDQGFLGIEGQNVTRAVCWSPASPAMSPARVRRSRLVCIPAMSSPRSTARPSPEATILPRPPWTGPQAPKSPSPSYVARASRTLP
jgi:putative serine protease PepD